MIAQVDWATTIAVFHRSSPLHLTEALLATCFAFGALAMYDVIAVRHLGLTLVTNARAATAGAVGYGVSNLIGLPWLTGALVRNVFYRGAGVGVGALMTVVMAPWVAFWVAVAAIIGTVLLIGPDITARLGLPIAGPWVGTVLLILCATLLLWLSRGREIRLGHQTVSLLARRVTLLQIGAALADLIGSATVLYVFLPADIAGNAASFFGLFVVAVGLGVLSHVPAGLGAFEGTMLLGLHADCQTDVTAALVMYRAFRTVLPFLVASGVLVAVVLVERNKPRQTI